VSADLRALSGLPASIKSSLAKSMSMQVDSSIGPPCAEEGAVVDCDEVGVGKLGCVPDGLEDGGWFDVVPDGDVPLEHPAVITARATTPAIENRFSRIERSFGPRRPIVLQARYRQSKSIANRRGILRCGVVSDSAESPNPGAQ
jgi:hypothetical protein